MTVPAAGACSTLLACADVCKIGTVATAQIAHSLTAASNIFRHSGHLATSSSYARQPSSLSWRGVRLPEVGIPAGAHCDKGNGGSCANQSLSINYLRLAGYEVLR